MRALLPKPEGWTEPQRRERGPRREGGDRPRREGDRGPRGPRREGGDRPRREGDRGPRHNNDAE